jgi:hypothetical protein
VRCIPILQFDSKLSNDQRAEQSKWCADKAMTMLNDAVAKGYGNTAQLKNDADLNPLRDREDFTKLLADLEAKAKPVIPVKPKPRPKSRKEFPAWLKSPPRAHE